MTFTNLSSAIAFFEPYIIKGVEALAILIVGWILAAVISRLIGKVIAEKLDQTMGAFIKQFSFYMLLLVVFIAVLSKLGVQTASLIAVLGGMSVAVGLSLRSSLSNLASGILVIMFKPLQIGDTITVNGSSGKVTKIELLFTYLQADSGDQIAVPNNQLVTYAVTKTITTASSA